MGDAFSFRRWFQLSPGRFLFVLLLAEVTLILTGRRDWFEIPRANGWTTVYLFATLAPR